MDVLGLKKVTLDNAEFVSWRSRLALIKTAVEQMRDANTAVYNAFANMSNDMAKFAETFENSYPDDDAFRALAKDAKASTVKFVELTKTNPPRSDYLQAYQEEIAKIEEDFFKVQKAFDKYQTDAKAREKGELAHKGEDEKVAKLVSTAEASKKEYETALADVIQRMKATDKKKQTVFSMFLTSNATLLSSSSRNMHREIQHEINFSASGAQELVNFDFSDYSEGNQLKNSVPDLSRRADVLTMQGDKAWIAYDNA